METDQILRACPAIYLNRPKNATGDRPLASDPQIVAGASQNDVWGHKSPMLWLECQLASEAKAGRMAKACSARAGSRRGWLSTI